MLQAAQHCAPADRLNRGHFENQFRAVRRSAPHRRTHQPAADAQAVGPTGEVDTAPCGSVPAPPTRGMMDLQWKENAKCRLSVIVKIQATSKVMRAKVEVG